MAEQTLSRRKRRAQLVLALMIFYFVMNAIFYTRGHDVFYLCCTTLGLFGMLIWSQRLRRILREEKNS